MNKFDQICRTLGLHPLVGFGMFVADWMLFGGESAIGAWPITIPIALALSIPCILIQKYGTDDGAMLAIGKGLMIGVLTAIPTALPSFVSLIGAALGLRALSTRKNATDKSALP
ncbi:MAG TPA: hypothetical protein PKD38_16165 [Nitrospira sp.]|nr:hypothetical protein [Nitrospira sp.]